MNILINILALFGTVCIILTLIIIIPELIKGIIRIRRNNIVKKQKELKILIERMSERKQFIQQVCLSYRHDYGLLSEDEQILLQNEYIQWLQATIKNIDYVKFFDGIKWKN